MNRATGFLVREDRFPQDRQSGQIVFAPAKLTRNVCGIASAGPIETIMGRLPPFFLTQGGCPSYNIDRRTLFVHLYGGVEACNVAVQFVLEQEGRQA